MKGSCISSTKYICVSAYANKLPIDRILVPYKR